MGVNDKIMRQVAAHIDREPASGYATDTVLNWAELVLWTGSALSNATIADYMDLDKEVLFYGTTGAGAASLLGLKRICHGTTCVF